MNQTHPNKRIVSKGEYAINAGKKAAHRSLGVSLVFLGGFGLTILGILLLLSLWMMTRQLDVLTLFYLALVACPLSIGSWRVLQIGTRTCREATQMETGVPLTRANTADLPALESLVRASQEPVQAQETVLLRAAAEGQATPPEQLVRAAGEQQE